MVTGLPLLRRLIRDALSVLLVVLTVYPTLAAPGLSVADAQAPPSRGLVDRIWRGVENAQSSQTSGCGRVVETRTSPLLARPLQLRGSFCVDGPARFRLDYAPPTPVRIVYSDGSLNVSLDGGKRIQAMDIGEAVGRVRDYFSGPNAARNLERDFDIQASDSRDRYALVLVPRRGRLVRRVRRIAVQLGKEDFLPDRIEITGASDVTSVFEIHIDELGAVDQSQFEVYRPR